MGLDAVELLMALEEGFGVAIADAEAEVCVTPAAVTDLIFGKLRAADERVCLSPGEGQYREDAHFVKDLGMG